jgi:integrase
VPEDENLHQDREYTRSEIQRLLKESDPRLRVVFLLLANGLRIGAISELKIGDLHLWPLPTDAPVPQKVYLLFVYAGTRSEYYTFLTPECIEAIDDNKDFRKKNAHEDIDNDLDSPLIRGQFPLYNKRHDDDDDVAIPKKMSKSSLQKTIQRKLKQAGLDTRTI